MDASSAKSVAGLGGRDGRRELRATTVSGARGTRYARVWAGRGAVAAAIL